MPEPNDEFTSNGVEQEVQEQIPIPHIPARPTRQSTSPDHELSGNSDSTTTATHSSSFSSPQPIIPQRPTSGPNKGQENKINNQQENESTIDESVSSSANQKFQIPVIPNRPLRQHLEEPIIPQHPTSTTKKEESVEPIIPPRPQRTKSYEPDITPESETTKSEANEDETEDDNKDNTEPVAQPVIPIRPNSKSNEPVIPSRPENRKSVEPEVPIRPVRRSIEPEVPVHPEGNHLFEPEESLRPVRSREEVKEDLDNLIHELERDLEDTIAPSVHASVQNEDETLIDPVTSESGLRLPSEGEDNNAQIDEVSEGQLNSENVNSLYTFGDGEVTPGNSTTKASFKSDEDEDDEHGHHLGAGDSSSFDDDVETISQEKEDGIEEGHEQQEPHLQEEEVQNVPHVVQSRNNESEENEGDETDTEPVESKREEPVESKEEDEIAKESPVKVDSKPATPIIPSRPPKKASLSRSTTEEESISLDEAKPNINKPIIPKRPTAESLTMGDESTSGITSKKPIIPVRPTKSSRSSSIESVPKLKPPPPKPKKLSSKIAAFQQQLFNPTNNSEPSDAEENKGEGEQSKPRKPVDSNKFLLRFGGKAIPLPGMFNPGQIPIPGKLSPSKDEADGQDDGSSRSVDPAPAVRRTRGPRGKKLPKSISETKVETESKFCLESGELFGLVFTKKVEEKPEVEQSDEWVADKDENDDHVRDDILDDYNEEIPKDEEVPKDEDGNKDEEVSEPVKEQEQEVDEDIEFKKEEITEPIKETINEHTIISGESDEVTTEEEPVHRVAVTTEPEQPTQPDPDVMDDDPIVHTKASDAKFNSSNTSLVDVKQEIEDELANNDNKAV